MASPTVTVSADDLEDDSSKPQQTVSVDDIEAAAPTTGKQFPAPSGSGYPTPVEPGNIQWYGRTKVPAPKGMRTPEGQVSSGNGDVYGTVHSASREENGLEVLYPQIYDGKWHSDEEAWQHYKQTGEHMGKFKNPDDADKYAIKYHDDAAAGMYDTPPGDSNEAIYAALPTPEAIASAGHPAAPGPKIDPEATAKAYMGENYDASKKATENAANRIDIEQIEREQQPKTTSDTPYLDRLVKWASPTPEELRAEDLPPTIPQRNPNQKIAAVEDAVLNFSANRLKGATLGMVDIPGGTYGLPFGERTKYTDTTGYSTPDVPIPTGLNELGQLAMASARQQQQIEHGEKSETIPIPSRNEIDAHIQSAQKIQAEALQKKQELDGLLANLDRTDQSSIDYYNARVVEFNRLLELHSAAVTKAQDAIQQYQFYNPLPESVGLRSAGEFGAVVSGSFKPYGLISRTVDRALLRIPGLKPLLPAPGLASGVVGAEEAIVPAAQVGQLGDAVSLLQRNQAIRRIAGQSITGSIFQAIQPREEGQTILGQAGQGAVIGAGVGVTQEMLGVAAKAMQDRQFGQSLEKLHNALSDELLSRQEVTLANGQTVTINSREVADQIAKDFLAQNLRPDVTTQDLTAAADVMKRTAGTSQPVPERPVAGTPTPKPPSPPEAPPAGSGAPKQPKPGPPEGSKGLLEQEQVKRGDTVLVPDAEGKPVEAKVDFAPPREKGTWVRVEMPDGSKAKFDRTQIGKVPETVSAEEIESAAPQDDKYNEAKQLVEEFGRASTSMLQRRLKIGYEEASGYVERMVGDGLAERQTGERLPVWKGKQTSTQPQTVHVSEVEKPSPTVEKSVEVAGKPVEVSKDFSAGDPVKVGERTGNVVSATKNHVKVDFGKGQKEIIPAEQVEKLETEYKFGSTQINIEPGTPLHEAHAEAAEQIKPEHLMPQENGKGIEDQPHITVRYGLKNPSAEQIGKIGEAVSKIPPFEVPVGKTTSFKPSASSEGAAPLIASIDPTPELLQLRKAVEGAGDFKEDTFPTYKPHISLGYVKPEFVHQYEGRTDLKGKTVPVKEIVVTDRDGKQHVLPLGKNAQQVGTAEGAKQDTSHFTQAMNEWKENNPGKDVGTGMSAIAQRAQELKDAAAKAPKYTVKKADIVMDESGYHAVPKEDSHAVSESRAGTLGAQSRGDEGAGRPEGGSGVGRSHEGQATAKETAPQKEAATQPSVQLRGQGAEATPAQVNIGKASNEPGPSDFLPEPGLKKKKGPTVIVARHGETAANGTSGDSVERVRGQSNIPLTPQGKKDAEALAKQLEGQGITHIVTSPLDRAVESARIIANHLSNQSGNIVSVETDKGLLPWHLGELQGEPVKEKLKELVHYAEHPEEKVPGGEAAGDFYRRFAGAMQRHQEDASKTGNVPLLMAHGRNMLSLPTLLSNGEKAVGQKGGPMPGSAAVLRDAGEGFKLADLIDPKAGEKSVPRGTSEANKQKVAEKPLAKAAAASQNVPEHTHEHGKGQPEGAPEQRAHPAEGRRQVPGSKSQDRKPLGEPSPQVPASTGISELAGSSARPDSGADDQRPEPVRGQGPESRPGQGSGLRDLEQPRKARVAKNSDWYSHPEDFNTNGPPSVRLARNLKALRILQNVQQNGAGLTAEDKKDLALYSGWGALPNVFDPYRAGYREESQWKKAYAELNELLTPEEFERARNSTVNAHFTSSEVVRWMWQAAQRLGFSGGTVLEPSMGTGNFFGMMPKGLRGKVNAIGNEMDPSTYAISKLLYPSATVYNLDYKDLLIPNDSIDLAIGNVPFGEKIYDPKYPKLQARIHDYFFVKTVDKVRPGGLIMFITSDGTLDKKSPSIRDILADRADLIYSARFPSSVFEQSAGTVVVTDMIVLRKRGPHDKVESEPFRETVPVPASLLRDAQGLEINQYYVNHPKNIIGTLETRRGRYGAERELTVKQDGPIADALKKTLESVPRDVMRKAVASPMAPGEMILAPTSIQEGNLTVHDGQIMVRENGALKPAESVLDKDGKPSPQLVDRAKRLIELRENTLELIQAMRTEPDPSKRIVSLQIALHKKYDAYVKKHGLLNERRTKDVFEDDHAGYPLLLSLEDYDREAKKGEKADIFSKRTIFPPAKLVALSDKPEEALYQVLSERGYPDLEFMGQLSGQEPKKLAETLIQKGLIFQDPTSGQYQTRDKYLSGYVRDKLDEAKAAMAQGLTLSNGDAERFRPNVEALEKAQPADIPIKDIEIRLGATYLPIDSIKDFVRDVLRGGRYADIRNIGGSWSVKDIAHSVEVTAEYAGGGVAAGKLLEDTLNLRQTVVSYEDPDGKRIVDQQKTIAAQAAQQKIRKAYAAYVRESKQWAPVIEHQYNRLLNAIVPPKRDGSHLQLPGMVRTHLRDGKLAPHQMDAVQIQIEDGRALLAHAVGAGKTYEAIVGAMELKRLGRIKKPMFAVPNHKVGDWTSDWQKIYPGSRLLVASKKDFQSTNRNRLMSKIATNDWDGIIVAHSQFDLMDISPERQRITMEREMDELEMTISALQAVHGKRDRSVKQLENAKDRLEAKLDALKDLKADRTILFDQLGVDHLVIDEIQRYKNLAFYTKMQRVSGLSQGNSKRALRLKMKTDYLLEKYNNRGVVGLTGTPVSNTMAEQRHMTNFIAPDSLLKANIKYFDDWAANFGEIITAMELSADARSFKPRSKFAKFVNVPEMQMLFRSFADVKTPEDLDLPVPKLEGGRPITVSVPSTELTEPYIKKIIQRAKAIRGEGFEEYDSKGNVIKDDKGKPILRYVDKPDPTEDNMLKVTTDGRKVATDARLIDPDLPDHPDSKINAVVRKVHEEWIEGQKQKLTQLVFLDMYRYTEWEGSYDEETGKRLKGKAVERLNLYHDMRQKWIERGIPAEEIAIIHEHDTEAKKQKLFDDVNAGRVRILMGSTQKMGEGMNVQRLLKSVHHVDAPWKPGELEQRNGRLIRQGNTNEIVREYHYVTKGSFDAYMLQTLQTKAEFIHQVMSGKFTGRSMIDAASDMVLSLEEMKAIASGNPDVKRKMELEAAIARFEALEREFDSQRARNLSNAGYKIEEAAQWRARMHALKEASGTWNKASEGDKFHAKILGKEFSKYEDAAAFMKDQDIPLAPFHFEINGVPFRAEFQAKVSFLTSEERAKLGAKPDVPSGNFGYFVPWESYPHSAETMSGLLRSINAVMQPKAMQSRIDDAQQEADRATEKAEKLEQLARNDAFPEAQELKEAERELREVNGRLGINDEQAAMEQQVAANVDSSEDAPEEGEDNGDTAYDYPGLTEGWDAVLPSPPEMTFHYEPADGVFPPIITVSRPLMREMVKAVNKTKPSPYRKLAEFNGMSMNYFAIAHASEALQASSDSVAQRLGQLFAENEDHPSGLIMIVEGAPERTLREELFHAAQRYLGGGMLEGHLSKESIEKLISHPLAQLLREPLEKMGYSYQFPEWVVAEIAAKIATLDERLFEHMTPQAAGDWFTDYLDELMGRTGPASVKILAEKLSKDARAFYETAYADAKRRFLSRIIQPAEGGGGDKETGTSLRADTGTPAQTGIGRSNPPPTEKTAPVEPPLYSLPATPPSGGPPKRFEFPDKDVQEEFDAARGLEKPSSIQAFKDFMEKVWHKATRTYEHLPRGAEYEQLRFNLKLLEKAAGVARDKAANRLQKILGELDKDQYYNFSVKVILDDLLETAKDGLEVPFFDSREQLEQHHAEITAFVRDDQAVQDALKNRKEFWDELKGKYVAAMEAIGFNVASRLGRENYYRHQVLQYALAKGADSGAKAKLKTPVGRGHLKVRKGSDLPINTDYLQAEHEVMAHFLQDIETARTIKFVHDRYDMVNELKKQAMAQNIDGIMEHFQKLAEMQPWLNTTSSGQPMTAEQMYRQLNVKQAMAIGRLGALAARNDLPNGTGKNDFSDLFDALVVVHNERAGGDEEAKLDDRFSGELIRYAAWVMKQESSAAKSAAATLFKGIQEKKAYIKQTLGKEYMTWKHMVPDGYSIWQPREGSTLYFTQTVPEQIVQKLKDDAETEIGIKQEDLRGVRAQGQRFREYVIPENVAQTLDNLRPDMATTLVGSVLRPITKAWKVWELSNPRRFVRFRLKHISGQAEAMFVGNPAAFKELPAAVSEIWDYYHDGNISPTLQGWLDRGGSGSSLLSQEVGAINRLRLFKRLHEAKESGKVKEVAERVWQGYWHTIARGSIDLAESVMRYSAYRSYLAQIRSNVNGLPDNWGASRPDEVKALKDARDKAWKMANDLLGAYDDITQFGKELRATALPFWSFSEINLRRAFRFIANAGYDPGGDGQGRAPVSGGGGEGKDGGGGGTPPPGNETSGGGWDAYRFGKKIASTAARKSPFLAYRLGKLLLKMSALWAAATAYNILFHREAWEQLSDEDKARPTVILWRNKDGKIVKLPRLGVMGELLSWFGLDAPQKLVRDWLNGDKTMADVATAMGEGPVNKLAQQTSEFLKMPAELLTRRSLYPDVFHPHKIRDAADYLARMMNLENEVSAIKGEPSPGYLNSWWKAVVDTIDEGSAAYYDISQRKRDYLEKIGKPADDFGSTPKGEALRNMRLAAHFGDEKAYEKFLTEYFENGGTLKELARGLKSMDPLAGLSRKEKIGFIGSLSDEDQNKLAVAEEYYLGYLAAGEQSTEEENTSDEHTGEPPPQ